MGIVAQRWAKVREGTIVGQLKKRRVNNLLELFGVVGVFLQCSLQLLHLSKACLYEDAVRIRPLAQLASQPITPHFEPAVSVLMSSEGLLLDLTKLS